jgi:elongation factor 1-beta
MSLKSYVDGYKYSEADSTVFGQFSSIPNATKYPHAYRWYIHIAALTGIRGLSLVAPTPSAPAAVAPAPAPAKKEAKKAAAADDEDDFDVFGDDDDDEKAPDAADIAAAESGETRAEMLARLKKEAEERTAAKELKQRTLVAIEIKPFDVEQDLMDLWKKITTTVTQDGLKWGENCTLADVAFGIKKIQCTFVMGVNNSSDDVVDKIMELYEDEVQSIEVTSMNVL